MRIRSPGICHCRARYREVRSPRVVEPGGDGSRLEITREQSCDADDEGAHELQGQVAPFACFGPVSPCYRWRAKPPRRTPGCTRFLFSSRALRGNHRAPGCVRCPVFLLLFTGKQAWTALDCTLGLRHQTRKCLRRRSLAAPAQGPQATRYSRSSRNGSAS